MRILYNDEYVSEKQMKELKNEIERLCRNCLSFGNLFSTDVRNRIFNIFENETIINFVSKYNKGTWLSDVTRTNERSRLTNRPIAKMNLKLGVHDSIHKHELWHALIKNIMQRFKNEYGSFYTAHGAQRLTLESLFRNDYEEGTEIGYGHAFDEAMAEIISVLATIKEKATSLNKYDGSIRYDDKVLAYADKFMQTGEIDPSLNIFRGHYKCFEDIGRLMILASRNDYIIPHPFSEVLKSDEGIDGMIDSPVNKPYSSFLYSNINVNTDFESEWDECAKKVNSQRSGRERRMLTYIQFAHVFDMDLEKVTARGLSGLTEDDKAEFILAMSDISTFYQEKLKNLEKNKSITPTRRNELENEFYSAFLRVVNSLSYEKEI